MAPEPRFTVLPLIPVPVVTIRPLLPDRLLMLMVFEASNVPSDVNAQGSRTAAWLGRTQRQNATVQARIIHLIDTVFSATVPLFLRHAKAIETPSYPGACNFRRGEYTEEGEIVPVKILLTSGAAGQAPPQTAEPVP
jgi:hypothetical protein